MKITIFSPISDFMLERFVSFENKFNGKNWDDLYQAISYLKSQYPDKKFNDVPYLYADLTNKTFGYIFIERHSDELFYVHK